MPKKTARKRKNQAVIAVPDANDVVWSDGNNPDIVSSESDEDIYTSPQDQMIVVPSAGPTPFETFIDGAVTTINEYLEAARSMKLPMPKGKLSMPDNIKNAFKIMRQTRDMTTEKDQPSQTKSDTSEAKENIPVQKAAFTKPTDYAKSDPKIPLYRPANQMYKNIVRTKAFEQIQTTSSAGRKVPAKNQTQIPADYAKKISGQTYMGTVLSVEITDDIPAKLTILYWISKLTSIFFFVVSLFLISIIGGLLVRFHAMGISAFVYLISSSEILLAPLFPAFISILYTFTTSQIAAGSKANFIAVLVISIAAPLSAVIAFASSVKPVIQAAQIFLKPDFPILEIIPKYETVKFFSAAFISLEIIPALSILQFSHFVNKPRWLTTDEKNWIGLTAFFTSIPILIIIAQGYSQSVISDRGYEQARTMSSRPLYRVDSGKNEFIQTSSYKLSKGSDIGLSQTVIFESYNALWKILKDGNFYSYTIKQEPIENGFRFDEYIFDSVVSDIPPQQIRILNAKNEYGYKTMKNDSNMLWFDTDENILVTIISEDPDIASLISLSESLY